MGMLTTKNPKGFLTPFAGLARSVTTVPIGGHASFGAAELAEMARSVGLAASPAAGVEAALDRIAATDPDHPPRVLICGSLYLAGLVLELNGTPPR
jgi:dihydrofolate synthase/folylpolyglutamate synthase